MKIILVQHMTTHHFEGLSCIYKVYNNNFVPRVGDYIYDKVYKLKDGSTVERVIIDYENDKCLIEMKDIHVLNEHELISFVDEAGQNGWMDHLV